MATESITHAFYFEGEAAERFVNALSEAIDGPGLASNITTTAIEFHGDERKEFIKKTWEEHEKRRISCC